MVRRARRRPGDRSDRAAATTTSCCSRCGRRLRGRLKGAQRRRRAAHPHRRVHRRPRALVRRAGGDGTAAAGVQPLPMIHLTRSVVRRWLERCCTSTTRRSGPRRRSRSACSSASRRFSACTRCSAIALAFLLNLNRVAVLLGVYSNLPWIIAPYYAFVDDVVGAPIDAAPRAARASRCSSPRCSICRRSIGEFWHRLIVISQTAGCGRTPVGSTAGRDRSSPRSPIRWRSRS